MRRGPKIAAAAVLLFVVASTVAFGQVEATVQSVRGQVAIRAAGGSWEPARVGMAIQQNTTVSTGFGSSAVLNLGRSVVEVGQLTRLTLEQLVEREGTVSTDVFVPVGRVRANVRTAEGRSADFEVRTPLSTAAVRGTEFVYDGWSLEVTEGVVAFANTLGQTRTVAAGQISVTTGSDAPSDPAGEQAGDMDDATGAAGGTGSSGTIVVRWRDAE